MIFMCKMSLLPLLPAQWACRGTDRICMTVCTGTNTGCTVMQTWTSTRTCRPQLLYIIGIWYVIGMDKVNVRGYFNSFIGQFVHPVGGGWGAIF